MVPKTLPTIWHTYVKLFEKNISTAKKRDIAPFKVNGQSHIILQQLSCGTRSKVSFVSNPAQI
jgi:hypothetical protein